ncbi:uncharacterized protein T551_00708 [Pneumocystis jirovecii RU7]|uniref:ATP synthase mitochondrial F1 complex assembly factor 1 n=1 Tax=Pneumocystis jirovecii (strain RU7) TaxID=1408657 RepID=A0A0W4ZUG5_PNEJ7|nr:uncharacterized protein T551_00708 [Pneumocystis jirovecii RU7]KTW32026.1 hypothetical protein T551_00708 [Pneumocystis jirovecii RU7]
MFFQTFLFTKKIWKRIYKINQSHFTTKIILKEFINKYRKKLEQKVEEEGLSSIQELFEKYTTKSNKDTSKTLPTSCFIQKNQNITQNNTEIPNNNKVHIKTLSSYIDVEKLQLHSIKEIELIWKARHIQNEYNHCGIISSLKFNIMEKNAKKYNMFILPINQPQGIEMHFLQWFITNKFTKYILITSLLEYKVKGEFARPHTFLSYHTDLSSDKNIVLMRGELEKDRGITMNNLKTIIFQIESFFSAIKDNQEDLLKLKLLEEFNNGKNFDVSILINECNKLH